MSFNYVNPLSSILVSGPNGVRLSENWGTNFSVLGVGGYMEVWSLSDLNFSSYGSTGNIQKSGNTIPINITLSPNPLLATSVVLNSDNISSGRRRLGMVVYVHENQQYYRFTIPNYETLYDAADSEGAIIKGAVTNTIYNRVVGVNKPNGLALIQAWTGSTIEGYSGGTRENANWVLANVLVTGATFTQGSGTLSLRTNTGGTINVTGFSANQLAVTGVTGNGNTIIVTKNDNSSSSFTINAATGGTFSNGVITLLGTGTLSQISGITTTSINGTTNRVVKFTGSTTIGNSSIFEDSSGNVGIGSDTPTERLFLNSGNLRIPTTSSTGGTIVSGTDLFLHRGRNNDSVYIGKNAGNLTSTTSSENIGIGTNVLNTITSGDNNLGLGNNTLSNLTTGSNNTMVGYRAGENNNGSGNIYLGYDAGRSINKSNELHISNSSSYTILYGQLIGAVAANYGTLGVNTQSYGGNGIVEVYDPGSIGVSVWGQTDIVAFSDERTKTDITKIDDAINKIKRINGVTYKRVDLTDTRRYAGVIAQEIEKVLPEVVHENTDGFKSVAYGNLVSLLIEGIKELSGEIENLKEEIINLKK
jgi:hypothetical protein